MEVIEKRRCSRGEAIATVKERAVSYAGATSKQIPLTETALKSMMDAAAEKAVAKHVEPLVLTMSQCLAQMQLLTAKLSEFIQAVPLLPASPRPQHPEIIADTALPLTSASSSAQGIQEMSASTSSSSMTTTGVPLASNTNLAASQPPESMYALPVSSSTEDSSSEMETAFPSSPLKSKRTRSPTDVKTDKGPKSKTKKGMARFSQSGDIVKQAIDSAQLESL